MSYVEQAKLYWFEKGYKQGAVASIAELLERIAELEEKLKLTVPVSSDGSAVFIDGVGEVPLNFERANDV